MELLVYLEDLPIPNEAILVSQSSSSKYAL